MCSNELPKVQIKKMCNDLTNLINLSCRCRDDYAKPVYITGPNIAILYIWGHVCHGKIHEFKPRRIFYQMVGMVVCQRSFSRLDID